MGTRTRLAAGLLFVALAVAGLPVSASATAFCNPNSTWTVPSDTFNSSVFGAWGAVSISGQADASSTWNHNQQVGAVEILPGQTVSVTCLTITNTSITSPLTDDSCWELPLFKRNEGSLVNLTSVNIVTDCASLLAIQEALCRPMLQGLIEVNTNYAYFYQWDKGCTRMRDVNITCISTAVTLSSAIPPTPPCRMFSAATVRAVYNKLVAYQDPQVPLTVVITNNLTFTTQEWPDSGLHVIADVRLAAPEKRKVILDFALQPNLFDVTSSEDAFLSFRGFVMLNLPLVYLPLDSPRRHLGILSTAMWPVKRNGVFMRMTNITLVLSQDEFKFWQYWITLLVSPLPTVRALSNWTMVKEVAVDPSGENYIQIRYWYGRYSNHSNLRYEGPQRFATQQTKGVLDITGNAQVPPTAVYQIKTAQDLSSAIQLAINAPEVQQYGLYVIFASNVTFPNATNDTVLTDPPLVITSDVTFTAWPGTYAFLDAQLCTGVITTMGSVRLRNLVMLNAGNLPVGPGDPRHRGLVSGIWLFNLASSSSDPLSNILKMDNVVIVVSQSEVDLYKEATITRKGSLVNFMTTDWLLAAQVHSYTNEWIYYSRLSTARFDATGVNITSKPPTSYVVIPLDPPASDHSHRSSKLNKVLLTAVAVGLPCLLVGALLTYICVQRRRLATMCKSKAPEQPAKTVSDDAVELVVDDSKATQQVAMVMHNSKAAQPPQSPSVTASPSLWACCTAPQADDEMPGTPPRPRGGFAARLAARMRQPVVRQPADPAAELQRLVALNAEIRDQQLEVHHSLGWGGHGVVYKGTWKGLPVAVKVVLIQGEERVSQKHLLEAAISASLIHPNIVTTLMYDLKPLSEADSIASSHSTGLTSGSLQLAGGSGPQCWKLYIVQEYCDQGTLKSAVDQGWLMEGHQSAVDLAAVLQIATDIACGIAHIHRKNIIHGDLTPSNVLLQSHTSRAQGFIAKVADFGLSVRMERDQTHRSRAFQGTPHYIAPEVMDKGILGKQADIFSFGVLLWELYNGTPSWRTQQEAKGRPAPARHTGGLHTSSTGHHGYGSSYSQPRHAAVYEDPEKLQEPERVEFPDFPRSCPKRYVQLARRCLHPDVAMRPTSDELLAELQEITQRHVG